MLQMEQKDYNMEIVNILAKGRNHIRRISELTGTNHMMISRKIKFLEEENVVDYFLEGRNKVYFLKKSPEARSYFLMSENYRLVRLLLRHRFLREFVWNVQLDKRIKFACFFGSYAMGGESNRSDIDVYIESENLSLKKSYSKLDSKLSIKLGKWDGENLLIKEIIGNHILIKGGELYYERAFN